MYMNPIFVHPTAEISKNAIVGKGTKIWHHTQIRERARIGKNCTLGKCCYVDVDVLIGNNVKIQNRASIYKGVKIEDDVFIGPHVVFTNDLYPRAFVEDWKVLDTLVKKGASIGANSVVICGIKIGKYAMVGAGSVVTKDIPDHALIFGNPAKVVGFVCKCGRKLETFKKNKEYILMKCINCNKKKKIPVKIYEMIV